MSQSATVNQEQPTQPDCPTPENKGSIVLRLLGALFLGSAVGVFLGFFVLLLMHLFSLAVV